MDVSLLPFKADIAKLKKQKIACRTIFNINILKILDIALLSLLSSFKQTFSLKDSKVWLGMVF